jgi:hypothetical protein
MWLSEWHPNSVSMIIQQKYATNKHKSFKIMKMKMSAILDKVKPLPPPQKV